jgi:hypothetical protein
VTCVVTGASLPESGGVGGCRLVTREGAENSGQTRMNTASSCHSDFFTVAASRAGLRIRNDEVVGSSPTSSTISNPSKIKMFDVKDLQFSKRLKESPTRRRQRCNAPDFGN